jgi:hypothetical protein
VRGRGGIVEHIYAKNIYMKDIAQEAIFFDMYYFVKFATDTPRDETPVVNEGTPIFRNMKFENIVCSGANKGIFIRGLSEMPIENIQLENMTLQAEIGAEFVDTKGISLKNILLQATKTKPVISVSNSSFLTFDTIKYPSDTETLLSIGGERTQTIKVQNTDLKKAKSNVVYKEGASASQVVMVE